jgi:uncharacterized repeat protein (TIGR03843 family)
MGDPAAALLALETGEIRIRGLMPDCSNYTYLAEVGPENRETLAVYKPAQGETPLDDFPEGTLGKREVAAYLVSEALGWRIVPPTVYRATGQLGAGSLQLFVDADFQQHYFTMMPARQADFRVMAAFDWIVNNADRKSGHCLVDADGHIWGVDNGLSFHPLPKLRTVIWDFAGDAVPERLKADAARLAGCLGPSDPLTRSLGTLLSREEIRALARRAGELARLDRYPEPPSRWAYPWPLV